MYMLLNTASQLPGAITERTVPVSFAFRDFTCELICVNRNVNFPETAFRVNVFGNFGFPAGWISAFVKTLSRMCVELDFIFSAGKLGL